MYKIIPTYELDNEIKYDETRGELYITPTLAVNRNLDLSLIDPLGALNIENVPLDACKQASKDVYRAILTRNPNKIIVLELMHNDIEYKELFKDWAIAQLKYIMFGGRVGEHTGFNAKSGKVTRLSDMRGDRMYSAEMLDEMRHNGILNRNFKRFMVIKRSGDK